MLLSSNIILSNTCTGSRGDVFVVRTSKPVENLWKHGWFWSRYSFVTHALYRKPRDWGLERSAEKATSSEYKALSKFIGEMNFLQLIKSPTRITDTTSTLLGVIPRAELSLNTPISDHLPVYVVLKSKLSQATSLFTSVCSYKNYNQESFAVDLLIVLRGFTKYVQKIEHYKHKLLNLQVKHQVWKKGNKSVLGKQTNKHSKY